MSFCLLFSISWSYFKLRNFFRLNKIQTAHYVRLEILTCKMMYDIYKTASYTVQQIGEIFYENQRCVQSVFRKLHEFYGPNRLSESFFSRNIKNFKIPVRWKTKIVKYHNSGHSWDNTNLVRESVADDPEMSFRRCSQQVGFSGSTTRRKLHKCSTLKAYKVLIT